HRARGVLSRLCRAGVLEDRVAHLPGEHGEPETSRALRVPRSWSLSASRQAGRAVARLRDRRAAARALAAGPMTSPQVWRKAESVRRCLPDTSLVTAAERIIEIRRKRRNSNVAPTFVESDGGFLMNSRLEPHQRDVVLARVSLQP